MKKRHKFLGNFIICEVMDDPGLITHHGESGMETYAGVRHVSIRLHLSGPPGIEFEKFLAHKRIPVAVRLFSDGEIKT